MSLAAEVRKKMGDDWLPALYRDRVRTGRTRAYTLALEPRELRTEIFYSLLGIELKAGNKRFACPDLGTARYLQVFARLGCDSCAVPYDITKIPAIADDLETSWHKSLLILDEACAERSASARGRLRSALIAELRNEIEEIGAGELMPEFRQSTKQRSP